MKQMKCGGEVERPVSNRYEIEITVRPLAGDEQDGLARVGLIPGEYAAFARIGNAGVGYRRRSDRRSDRGCREGDQSEGEVR
jgi:hypothetical protein